jgi:hypothetical protein
MKKPAHGGLFYGRKMVYVRESYKEICDRFFKGAVWG